MKDFFTEISGGKPVNQFNQPADFSTCLSSSPGREPFQTVSDSPTPSPSVNGALQHAASTESLKSEKSSALFIKSFVFSPEVPIRLDYQGKHVNIEQVC